MEKIVKIKLSGKEGGEIEIPTRSTAASLINYKANFREDGMKALLKLGKSMPSKSEKMTDEDIMSALVENDFDFDLFTRFLWVFAKAKNENISPYEDWLDSFDIAPLDFIVQAFPQVIELLMNNVKSTVKSKN